MALKNIQNVCPGGARTGPWCCAKGLRAGGCGSSSRHRGGLGGVRYKVWSALAQRCHRDSGRQEPIRTAGPVRKGWLSSGRQLLLTSTAGNGAAHVPVPPSAPLAPCSVIHSHQLYLLVTLSLSVKLTGNTRKVNGLRDPSPVKTEQSFGKVLRSRAVVEHDSLGRGMSDCQFLCSFVV